MMQQQITFDIVLNREMCPEIHIPVNNSVDPQDKPRLSRQAQAIHKRLKQGPATTSELAGFGLQYNARISEIRHVIVKDELMIDESPGAGGENEYSIVPLSKSTFWKRIKEKGEAWKWLE